VKNDHLRYESKSEQTFDSLWLDTKYVISIEEGCNGLNIMILFFAFVVGFGGKLFNMLVFIPTGIIFIHVANLARLLLLSLLNVNSDGRAFHFFHKYGFTAILYVAILFLWYLWVMRWNGRNFAKDDILKNEEDF
jgi:exosortase family protein XrtF